VVTALVALLATLTACGAGAAPSASQDTISGPTGAPSKRGTKLRVVATTTIVGDVVRQIGGDAIELTVLLPVGSDPHGFEPTPKDVTRVADADAIFINGLGLEGFLGPLMENAGSDAKIVPVSAGIEPRQFVEGMASHENDHEGETGHEHAQSGGDPHVWTSPHNVMVWTQNIAQTLSDLDPDNTETYDTNARLYQQELETLDAWVREQVSRIPEGNREIVTDHAVFGYFADRYGFIQVGAVVPGYSTLAESSAQELARLEDAIRDLGVKAIFVGNTVNPNLARRVAEDTSTQLVFVYTGSLSEKGGPADNYLDFIRYNVDAIANALK